MEAESCSTSMGVVTHEYRDNWLIVVEIQERLSRNTQQVLDLYWQFGFYGKPLEIMPHQY